MRPRLLDLFCGAGGAATGYHCAGFDVAGVDNKQQSNYPYPCVWADALDVLRGLVAGKPGWWLERQLPFDAIHASPPCQAYSSMTKQHGTEGAHPDLVAEVRELLDATGLPYVIENVVGAPLIAPVTLCGSMFGLGSIVEGEWRQLRRHRLFESNVALMAGGCSHTTLRTVGVYGKPGGSSTRDGLKFGDLAAWKEAMGIDWMTARELALAIPPAYTEARRSAAYGRAVDARGGVGQCTVRKPRSKEEQDE